MSIEKVKSAKEKSRTFGPVLCILSRRSKDVFTGSEFCHQLLRRME